jgi:hypothetical protein
MRRFLSVVPKYKSSWNGWTCLAVKGLLVAGNEEARYAAENSRQDIVILRVKPGQVEARVLAGLLLRSRVGKAQRFSDRQVGAEGAKETS